ncbi:MAG TPA: hypothetical protein VE093_13550 [Polyangiaceae bacterium]|nr:hypothetical protein [Polyangiaceae bacterium]
MREARAAAPEQSCHVGQIARAEHLVQEAAIDPVDGEHEQSGPLRRLTAVVPDVGTQLAHVVVHEEV